MNKEQELEYLAARRTGGSHRTANRAVEVGIGSDTCVLARVECARGSTGSEHG